MLERNKIYCIDVLDGLRQLDDESVDVIITSPPYNKGFSGAGKNYANKLWNNTIDYGGDPSVDNLPEDEYEKWQIEILNECYRVLKPDGSMFYNHKNRIWTGHGEIISPYKWLFKTNFKIRQEIIWDRGSTSNVAPQRYLPCTELIFWLTKSAKVRFDRKIDTPMKKEVWSFPFEKGTKHPAPFPKKLPDNILSCIPQKENENLLVLDPFMGSGTTAKSAIEHGFDYIGFEKFQEYIDMANKKINNNEECLKK